MQSAREVLEVEGTLCRHQGESPPRGRATEREGSGSGAPGVGRLVSPVGVSAGSPRQALSGGVMGSDLHLGRIILAATRTVA